MDKAAIIDEEHSACLCDVGQPDYVAATAVDPDGTQHLVLARQDAIGDLAVTYSTTCAGVAHEQLGPLPLEYVSRITITRRRQRGHRCGRRTRSGTVCRMRVSQPGAACEWHRTTTPERQR